MVAATTVALKTRKYFYGDDGVGTFVPATLLLSSYTPLFLSFLLVFLYLSLFTLSASFLLSLYLYLSVYLSPFLSFSLSPTRLPCPFAGFSHLAVSTLAPCPLLCPLPSPAALEPPHHVARSPSFRHISRASSRHESVDARACFRASTRLHRVSYLRSTREPLQLVSLREKHRFSSSWAPTPCDSYIVTRRLALKATLLPLRPTKASFRANGVYM